MKAWKILTLLFFIFFISNQIFLAWEGKVSLKELTKSSHLILDGKVIDIASRLETKDKQELIFTYVTISVNSILKGSNKEPEIILKMAGGKIGENGTLSEEYQAFSKDEEVLLFLYLDKNNDGYWKISGVSGKLSVIEKNGIKYYDGKMLKEDEDTKLKEYPLLQSNDVKIKIKNYLLKG